MIEWMGTGGHTLHQCGIGHRAGHRPTVIEAVEVRRRAIGVAAMGRLEADDTTSRSGNADRAANIGAGGQGGDACRQGRTGAARRAAGRPAGVPWVPGDTPHAGVGDTRQAELRNRGAGENIGAGILQAFDHRVGMIVNRVLEDQRTVGGALAFNSLGVLHRQRNAIKRQGGVFRVTGFGAFGFSEGFFKIGIGEAVDLRVDGFGAGDEGLQAVPPATACVGGRASMHPTQRGSKDRHWSWTGSKARASNTGHSEPV